MTLQEILDISTRGIISQGGPSMGDGQCYYRSPNGRKCAAGWIIPDEDYQSSFEGQTSFLVDFFKNNFNIQKSTFIRRLQMAHDNASSSLMFFSSWKSELENIRCIYSDSYYPELNWSVLEEIPNDVC